MFINILPQILCRDKEEFIKFCKSSTSRSGYRNLLQDSSALRDSAFSTTWLTYTVKLIGYSWKLSHMYLHTRKSPFNFAVIRIPSPDPERSHLGRRMCSPSALLMKATHILPRTPRSSWTTGWIPHNRQSAEFVNRVKFNVHMTTSHGWLFEMMYAITLLNVVTHHTQILLYM